MSAVEQPSFEFPDSTLGIQDPTISFSLSPSSWDNLDWQRKSTSADPPYTPSYASYNSPGSNQSGLSGQLDVADDEFEYMNSQRTPYNSDSPFSLMQQEEDEGYNPTHYSTGTEEFALLEDHFLGHDQSLSSPQLQITAAPPNVFAPRQTPDHSPASSAGELEPQPRSRASSVSSYNISRVSPAPPPSFNESLAKLNFGTQADSSDPRSQPPSPFVSSLTISADAPSPPPSSTTSPATPSNGSKPLGRPLIIPPTPSITANFSLSNEEFGSQRNSQTSQQYPSGYLLPPQNPSLHIGQNYSARTNDDMDAGGLSIRLIPSTPVSAGGANAAHDPPFQQSGANTGDSQSPFKGPQNLESSSTPSWNIQSWSQDSSQPSLPQSSQQFNDQGDGNVYNQQSQSFDRPTSSSWSGDSLLIGSNFSSSSHPATPPPRIFAEGANNFQSSNSDSFSMGHRPRSASHSGTSARPHWQDTSTYPMYPYQNVHQIFPNRQNGQGTVAPNELFPPPLHSARSFDLGSLDHHSLVPMSPDPNQNSLPSEGVQLRINDTPSSPSFNSSTLHPPSGSPTLRRNRSTGSTPAHRRGSKSEDIGYGRGALGLDSEAFIKSITSQDGLSLIPPDPRSPPAGLGFSSGSSSGSGHRGRRSSSSSVGSDRGSPYSRPSSVSPHGSRTASPMPSIGKVERQNVTTPATELASANRRKNRAPFTCPVEGCGSTFTRQFNLKGHLRSHREERPYVCKWPKCGKGFARQHDCKRHEALHLNIRPFTCDGCGKTFARMDALNRHHKSEGGTECRRSELDNTTLPSALNGAGTSVPEASTNPAFGGGRDFSSYLGGWTQGASSYVA